MRDILSDARNSPPEQPELKLSAAADYRSSYANSVQVRMTVWDFFLVFGTMHQENPTQVAIDNFQGIYLSPQQAKALWNVLGANLAQYEQTFGVLALEPKYDRSGEPRFVTPVVPPGGPVN